MDNYFQNFREACLNGFRLVDYPMNNSIHHLGVVQPERLDSLGWRAKLKYYSIRLGLMAKKIDISIVIVNYK